MTVSSLSAYRSSERTATHNVSRIQLTFSECTILHYSQNLAHGIEVKLEYKLVVIRRNDLGYERIRQWPVTDITVWLLVNESSRNNKKNRIAFKIWTAVPRVEKYRIGAAVQILETIRFILFRNDSSNMRRFIYERLVTKIRDWSLTYSFIFIPDSETKKFFF